MNWFKTPWSLKRVVSSEGRKWLASNSVRQRFKLSALQRELIFAGEHPFRFAFSLLILQVLLLVLASQLPDDWLTPVWRNWEPAEQLSYFATLWAVQATLAALVYPIVIAFVAVFLQRRPAAEAIVHLYMLDSGALAAGLSSVGLVVVMGGQYLLLVSWGSGWLPSWTAVDTVWFIVNAAMTTYFLFRTIEFLRPDIQSQVVRRYAVSVALPREVASLTAYQVLMSGRKLGWFPIPMYGDAERGEPTFYIGRFAATDSGVHGVRHLRGPHRLDNIRLWPLRIALSLWAREAERQSVAPQQTGFGQLPREPRISMSFVPGTTWESQLALARVDDGPAPSKWQLTLLWWATVLTPTAKEHYGIKVQAILAELSRDAQQAASQADNEAFIIAFDAVVGMHKLLLNACVFIDDDGKRNNWALLPQINSGFARALHESWREVYRTIFQSAIRSILLDTRPIGRLSYLLPRLEADAAMGWPLEIREGLFELPPLMMFQLGEWWSRRVEEQGNVKHTHLQMVSLLAPLNRAYEEVLGHFVGGWENASPSKNYRLKASSAFVWETAYERALLNVKHIEETAKMLLDAVHRGDQSAAVWMADSLGKWWDSASFDGHPPYQLHRKADFITIDHLRLSWDEFVAAFSLDGDVLPLNESQGQQLKYGAYMAALRNYWKDLRLIVIELLTAELLDCNEEDAGRALSTEIAVGMLTGKQWKGGGRASEEFRALSATDYLTSKVRQYCGGIGGWRDGYIGMLDKFVSRTGHRYLANMVTSRVYVHGGADGVESLQGAQVVLFGVLTSAPWKMSSSLESKTADWIGGSPVNIEVLRTRLAEWIRSADAMGDSEWGLVAFLKSRAREAVELQVVVEAVKSSLAGVAGKLEGMRDEAVAAQAIHPQRLIEIAKAASVSAFRSETGDFPLHLLGVREPTPRRLKDFTFTLKKYRRGELTEVELEQRAANEAEFFDEMLTSQVGVVVLSDILQACTLRTVSASEPDLYWRLLKTEAANLASRGQEAVLLLDNGTRPEWVWDWQYPEGRVTYRRPDDMQVQRREGQGKGYACHFNDIAVYVAQLPYGESLLMPRQTFVGVTFTQFGPEQFVDVSVDESAGMKGLVDLKFTFSREVQVERAEVVRLLYQDKDEQ